jgi:uncharacterized membrane protein YkgB
MNEFATAYYIFWSLIAIGVGLFGSLFTSKFVSNNARFFNFFYKKTRLILFKKQAEEMVKPYMYVFSKVLGIIFVILGITILLKNIL